MFNNAKCIVVEKMYRVEIWKLGTSTATIIYICLFCFAIKIKYVFSFLNKFFKKLEALEDIKLELDWGTMVFDVCLDMLLVIDEYWQGRL